MQTSHLWTLRHRLSTRPTAGHSRVVGHRKLPKSTRTPPYLTCRSGCVCYARLIFSPFRSRTEVAIVSHFRTCARLRVLFVLQLGNSKDVADAAMHLYAPSRQTRRSNASTSTWRYLRDRTRGANLRMRGLTMWTRHLRARVVDEHNITLPYVLVKYTVPAEESNALYKPDIRDLFPRLNATGRMLTG